MKNLFRRFLSNTVIATVSVAGILLGVGLAIAVVTLGNPGAPGGAPGTWNVKAPVVTETDPTVNALGKATLSCSSGQVAKWNGSSWACAADSGIAAETDPTVKAFAKVILPTCAVGQVLKGDGTNLSCVTDQGITAEADPKIGTLTDNYVPRWAITGKLINGSIFDNGNVGIGTATPGGRLTVIGNGATSATYALNVTDSAGTNSHLFVRDDGNVGIGTTAPGQKLSVAGIVESTTGGFKFPDGTTQTTAGGGSGLFPVTACASGQALTWNGTSAVCTTSPPHTPAQCTAVGGVVATGVCKFLGVACPPGWVYVPNYTATTSVTCLTQVGPCTTGSHVFGNTPIIETCGWGPPGNYVYNDPTYYSCTATVTAVGCQ